VERESAPVYESVGEGVVGAPRGQVAPPAAAPESPLSIAAQRYLELGDRAFREGRYFDAVQFYAKAVEFAPDQGALYLVLSDALFAAGYGSVSRFYEKPQLGMKARDYRARGKGQRIRYSCFATRLGTVLAAMTDKGLCSIKLGDNGAHLRQLLAEEFPNAELCEDPLSGFKQQILSFIDGEASLVRVPLDIRGTVFQRRVWETLRRIPRGETRTYQDIARAIGAPRAVRAVGSACGANPIALAVPCHRAVRTDGGLGGYAWGIQRKRKLLALEKKR